MYVREVILDTSTANDNLEETRGSDVLELPVLEVKLEDKLIHVLEDALNAEVGKRTEIPGTELYLIKSKEHPQNLEIKNNEKNISSGSEQFIIERLEMLASSKSIKIINENFWILGKSLVCSIII